MNGSTADTGIIGEGMADAGMVKGSILDGDIVDEYMGRSGS